MPPTEQPSQDQPSGQENPSSSGQASQTSGPKNPLQEKGQEPRPASQQNAEDSGNESDQQGTEAPFTKREPTEAEQNYLQSDGYAKDAVEANRKPVQGERSQDANIDANKGKTMITEDGKPIAPPGSNLQ